MTSRPVASAKYAAAARRAGARLLQECRKSGTPTEIWPQGWNFREAAAIAKHLRPGDARIAQAAYLLLVAVMVDDIQSSGCTFDSAPPLERALATFLEGEGYEFRGGKFFDAHTEFEALRRSLSAPAPAVTA